MASFLPSGRNILAYLEYAVIRFAIFLFGLLPYHVREGLTAAIAIFLSWVLRKEWELIRGNIRSAFPQRGEDWIRRTARKYIRYQGKLIAEFFDFSGAFGRNVDALIRPSPPMDEIVKMAEGGGIVILGHVGNWEWTGMAISRWMPGRIYALDRKPHSPRIAGIVERVRRRNGMRTAYTGEGLFRYKEILMEKKLFCLLADLDAGKRGRFFRFLDRPASTNMGPAVLARATGCRAFFAWSWHESEGIEFRFEELPKPDVDPAKNPKEWEDLFTEQWVRLLEQAVRKHPEEYLWVHDRWKTPPIAKGNVESVS